MLEPREADIPALFLFLVVLPLVAYILLGKWSEAAKKRERIGLLAQLAAEEALRAEKTTVSTACVSHIVSSSRNGLHLCARCFGPATTRCSRCKSVRYCSGRCQIIHWRQIHNQQCMQLEITSSSSSPEAPSFEDSILDRVLFSERVNLGIFGYDVEEAVREKTSSDNVIHPSTSNGVSATADCSAVDIAQFSILGRKCKDKQASRRSNREMLRREDIAAFNSLEESCRATNSASCNNSSSKEAFRRHKSRIGSPVVPEEEDPIKHNAYNSNLCMHESHKCQSQHENVFDPRSTDECTCSSYPGIYVTNVNNVETDFTLHGGNVCKEGNAFNDETVESNHSAEMKAKHALQPPGTKTSKSTKSTVKVSGGQSCSEIEIKREIADESKVPRARDNITAAGSNGVTSMNIMKMMGLRKSVKVARQDAPEAWVDRNKKMKMLFPYEEFVKLFQCEVFDLLPRGLLNCGNSCYANAVLQCLTCTKPLIIYLLRRSHSKTCSGKNWCLMCELELHVLLLRETGGPLSPRRILSHMRSINCQIGDGSQEDAHEFLRLLVASMQAICLEGVGGEKKVDPRQQETTFVQHTFGGRLRSKVKCLRCHHQSERYENMMDLTLEIYGWVESLEDALTQFTTPEDLDGENMYRCGRCAAYVRARKQLSIHEAPNILTIVLKRFQEGRYGKINKCISFPDMLNMIPFMTGTGDIPPLYVLYAVVVHLDTLNASFSGHYVSYVKNMQGNWFRIDDTEVHPVPMSQVMSEGAYMLFYIRSCPRPQRSFTGNATQQQVAASATHSTSNTKKPSQAVQPMSDLRSKISEGFSNCTTNGILRSANQNILPVMGTYSEPVGMEFSDATSSEWSLFTSSDEASFTTESTRDSFSAVDYADTCNADPTCSIFNNIYASELSSGNTVCCKTYSYRPQTRVISEEKGYIIDSGLSTQTPYRVRKQEKLKQVSDSLTEFSSGSNCGMYVNCGSNPKYGHDRTSSHCKL
ncbi:UCH domain-containing protein/zf-MYND domain-containing protein [Cephalotus follicularis]|uniref:ubiquitinyl hydrolase 1 n=1 Tax=Cephalotus follicularis TaxID=3775 RepID=A0A1Q3AYS6_CEPFO|nr:UCH domain-containing protein/zf-MYND domain-containing protein [Cephalotus follicularis]